MSRYRGPLYGTVPRALWERRDLSRDAKVLHAYLCSCPGAGGLSGIFRLDRALVRDVLRFSPRRTGALLAELERALLVVSEDRFVWIVDETRMTPGFSLLNENHVRAIETALAQAPPSIAEAYRRRYLSEPTPTPVNEHPNAHPDAHGDERPDEHGHPGTGAVTGTESVTATGTGTNGSARSPVTPLKPMPAVTMSDEQYQQRLALLQRQGREVTARR